MTTVTVTQPVAAALVSVDPGPSVTLEVGIRGPSGLEASAFTFTQPTPATTWTVNHNLGREPLSVRVLTTGGIEMEAQITQTSSNQLVVSLASAQVGRVIVS